MEASMQFSELSGCSYNLMGIPYQEWTGLDVAQTMDAADDSDVEMLLPSEEELQSESLFTEWDNLWKEMPTNEWSSFSHTAREDGDGGAPSPAQIPSSPSLVKLEPLKEVKSGCYEMLLVTSVEGPQELTPSRCLWLEGEYDSRAFEIFGSDAATGSQRLAVYHKLRRHMHSKSDDKNRITAELDFSAKLEVRLHQLGLDFFQISELSLKAMQALWRTTHRRADSSLQAALECKERRQRAARELSTVVWGS